jgi:hypothetical protein
MVRSRVVQTKQNDADDLALAVRQNLAEVEIKREHDPFLSVRLREDLAVGKSLQPFFAEMHDIVASFTKQVRHSHGNPHVRQESHTSPPSGRLHLFLRQPSCVFEGLHDVCSLQIGEITQYFVPIRAVSDLAHNHRDRDTHAADRGSTTEDLCVKCDSVKHVRFSPQQGQHATPAAQTLGCSAAKRIIPQIRRS